MARFDIKRVADLAQNQIDAVLAHWAPEGNYKGVEYIALNPARSDDNKGSFSVNRNTGAWADFATDAKGGDLVSLVAYLEGMNNGDAAQRLAVFLRLSDSEAITLNRKPASKPRGPAKSGWEVVMPVPLDAVKACPTRHPRNGLPSAEWEYRNHAGLLLMKVLRFDLQKTGKRAKEYRPLTYCRDTRGKYAWRWKQPEKSRPLYGLNRLGTRVDAPVLLTEGEKAADAAVALLPDYVSMSWPGGSKALGKTDFGPLRGRQVVLWPDNDEAGTYCMQKLAVILHGLGCAVSLLRLQALGNRWPVKGDAADAEAHGLTAEQLAALLAAGELLQAYTPETTVGDKGNGQQGALGDVSGEQSRFVVNDRGVFFSVQDADGEASLMRICARLDVIALTRDPQGRNWGTLVRFVDPDGVVKEWNIPSEYLATEGGAEVLKQLYSMGLRAEAGQQPRRRLIQYLQTAKTPDRYILVNKLGWHGQAYLLPNETLGTPTEPLYFYSTSPDLNKIKICGALEHWREQVAAYCTNNSRLLFAVSAAFAGPLLHMIGMETTGFHFFGDSSQGKTTLLKVAASVYGGPDFLRTWRSTDNALESIAAAHSDGLLVLDEISQCDPRIVGDIAYMLGNGTGKARANDRGGVRGNAFEWRLVFLSTGERTLDQQMAEAGKKAKAGQEVRLLAVPSDAGSGLGIFNTLHDFAGGAPLSRHLVDQASLYHGAPLRAFIEALCASNHDKLTKRIRLELVNFAADLSDKASGQVRRTAEKFALVGFAGEMASKAGITGWPQGMAMHAAHACFKAWIAARGGIGNLEDQQSLHALRLFFDLYGESHFTRWDREDATADDHTVRTLKRCGYRKTLQDSNALEGPSCSETIYYVYPAAFKAEICKGLNDRRAKQLLAESGALERDSNGKFSTSTRLPNSGRNPERVLIIRPHLIPAGGDGEGQGREKQVA
ncbi:DUF927 domain-containing protein [uncultured Microbulbifer sp.]|uniref:DUF927 domain-containing protein n=1 Tax=uncultured Microbulbifer sp. TaxID=348147 RepID=UPI00260D5F2B|nr:DUF927 domain-containing protein [uncultured Microbulbifer sp.]